MLGQRQIFPDWVEEEGEKLFHEYLESDEEDIDKFLDENATKEYKEFFEKRRKMIEEEYKKGVIVE